MYDSRQDVLALQQEDLSLFGSLILSLGCSNTTAASNPAKALEIFNSQYSPELRNLVLFLTTKHGPPKVDFTSDCLGLHFDSWLNDQSISHVLGMIGNKMPGEIDGLLEWVSYPLHTNQPLLNSSSSSTVDRLESELMSELENGRLVRLLCKFGFINERPEYVNHYLDQFTLHKGCQICSRTSMVRDWGQIHHQALSGLCLSSS